MRGVLFSDAVIRQPIALPKPAAVWTFTKAGRPVAWAKPSAIPITEAPWRPSTYRTVRDVTYQLLRKFGLTTVFGNVGSTEETFLKNFPSDFRHVRPPPRLTDMADRITQQLTGHMRLHCRRFLGGRASRRRLAARLSALHCTGGLP